MISWKLTNNPDLINKVKNGQSTTYKRGTQGWHEFEQWKALSNVPEPYQTIQDVTPGKIQELKQRCASEIETPFPVWKQLNIQNKRINQSTGLAYTDQDLSGMSTYIEGMRQQCHTLEAQVNAASTIEEVNAITWG